MTNVSSFSESLLNLPQKLRTGLYHHSAVQIGFAGDRIACGGDTRSLLFNLVEVSVNLQRLNHSPRAIDLLKEIATGLCVSQGVIAVLHVY